MHTRLIPPAKATVIVSEYLAEFWKICCGCARGLWSKRIVRLHKQAIDRTSCQCEPEGQHCQVYWPVFNYLPGGRWRPPARDGGWISADRHVPARLPSTINLPPFCPCPSAHAVHLPQPQPVLCCPPAGACLLRCPCSSRREVKIHFFRVSFVSARCRIHARRQMQISPT